MTNVGVNDVIMVSDANPNASPSVQNANAVPQDSSINMDEPMHEDALVPPVIEDANPDVNPIVCDNIPDSSNANEFVISEVQAFIEAINAEKDPPDDSFSVFISKSQQKKLKQK